MKHLFSVSIKPAAAQIGVHLAWCPGAPDVVEFNVEHPTMQKLQSQGVHHITLTGANRQTSIDFWEGVLGMPFLFEQPNLDNTSESHLYFASSWNRVGDLTRF